MKTMAALAVGPAVLCLAMPPLLAEEAGPAEPWFTVRRVADGVRVIDDHGADNMYLVEGTRQALLIDTGLGAGRLSELVKTLTPLPVVVVNTHGHPDHAGGNYQFATVHAHALDFDATNAFNTAEARRATIGRAATDIAAAGLMRIEEAQRMPTARLEPVTGGFVFDLGGRKLEVIEQPGHTPGEIVLLDAANRLLFTGDNNSSLVWLFLANSLPLERSLESLKKLRARGGEFETILPGHGPPHPRGHIDDQIACIESILDGTCKGAPYKAFVGEALTCKHNGATVAFNPANLRLKD